MAKSLKWNKSQEGTAMILRKSVPGPPMGIFDGHIVRFSGGFCQTSFALRTTVLRRPEVEIQESKFWGTTVQGDLSAL